jgi:hypothetical protein
MFFFLAKVAKSLAVCDLRSREFIGRLSSLGLGPIPLYGKGQREGRQEWSRRP